MEIENKYHPENTLKMDFLPSEMKKMFNDLELKLNLEGFPNPPTFANIFSHIVVKHPEFPLVVQIRVAAWQSMLASPPKVNEFIEQAYKTMVKAERKDLTAAQNRRKLNAEAKERALKMFGG